MRRALLVAVLLAGSAPAQETGVAFRVRFGVTDTHPQSWDGKITVKSGGVRDLRLWRPRPKQEIIGNTAWKLATEKGVNFKYRPWEREPTAGPRPYLIVPGLIVDVSGNAATRVRVETKQGSFEVTPAELAPGAERKFLNGSVLVDLVPAANKLSNSEYQNDFATLLAAPGGQLWAAWVAYRAGKNHVHVRRYDGARWGKAEEVSENHGDIFLVKAGRDRDGGVWVVWSAQIDGNFDLYGRRFHAGEWGGIERLTTAPEPDIFHAMETDAKGNLWLAWQGFRKGKSEIFVRRYDGTEWSAEEAVSLTAGNDWEPAIAADSKGSVYVAWDTYDQGNYDVMLSRFRKGEWSERETVAGTPKFEAHVSLVCDRKDRLWAAWNEGGTQWGKDTGFLIKRQGTRLYQGRWMAVAVRGGNEWREPVEDIAAALPPELRGYNDLPVLAADNAGRVWVVFRHRRPRIIDVPSDAPMHRAAWELYATSYSGSDWSLPIAIPFSRGRTDMHMGLDTDEQGNLYAAWPTDNRDFDTFLFRHAEVYTGRIPTPSGEAPEAKLRTRVPEEITSFPLHAREAADIARIRSYAIRSGGKTYHIYRGDTHRHTEFSMDGNNDGSLIDTYRYAMDAASLDFLMVSEHNFQGGPDVEYVNWLLQQTADLMFVPQRFVPLYGYERSITYPDGHRNVIFAKRGNPTLPISPAQRKHQQGAGALFDYLKKYDGISIPHTSATGMGTDWRDNDPEVEPLVEIFQGDRVSAEYEGAPRAAWGGKPTGAPGRFRPAGFVWNAWAKGYKLGVQASSDHLSTHISYACTIAEEYSREGLLAAMKQRHSYAATDNIVLDYRLRDGDKEYLQGDIVSADDRFLLWIKIVGTAPVRQIDIIKDNTFLHTRQPMKDGVEFTYVDTRPGTGDHYYYVRVQQVDNQIAWSSPIWVTVE